MPIRPPNEGRPRDIDGSGSVMRSNLAAAGWKLAGAVLLLSSQVGAEPGEQPAVVRAPTAAPPQNPGAAPAVSQVVVADRVVVRFTAPEAGGKAHPHFIFQRQLAFEARLVALADLAHPSDAEPYRRHHLQAALERHISETLLATLAMTPAPTGTELAQQQQLARDLLLQQVGGEERLNAAAQAEGIGSLEVRALLRRRARASLYLDRMVAPMLQPTALELRRTYAEGKTPFSRLPYAQVEPSLRRWYVGRSLALAVSTYFQNARARLQVVFLDADTTVAAPSTSAR